MKGEEEDDDVRSGWWWSRRRSRDGKRCYGGYSVLRLGGSGVVVEPALMSERKNEEGSEVGFSSGVRRRWWWGIEGEGKVEGERRR
ncbi:hypothetical protein HAX54_009802 [Datura stramonium]|uniref:Uncharacterized protein n=1 Tax=Datura stramonium TaxID=4076 RepID=A0ABS8X0K5_DATST|nr:hypothetical protein [Datura stramonium]